MNTFKKLTPALSPVVVMLQRQGLGYLPVYNNLTGDFLLVESQEVKEVTLDDLNEKVLEETYVPLCIKHPLCPGLSQQCPIHCKGYPASSW